MDENAPPQPETSPRMEATQPGVDADTQSSHSSGIPATDVNTSPQVDKNTPSNESSSVPTTDVNAPDVNAPPEVDKDTSSSKSNVAGKKKYVPKAKADRLTRRGWADGWRSVWLTSMLPGYRRVAGDSEAENEYLEMVYRQYFTKCHWSIPDEEEPPFPVNEWRPDVPMPVESLTDEQMVEKRTVVAEKKSALKRWFQYRDQHVVAGAGGMGRRRALDSPYAIIWAKLSGTAKPGKARQAFQEWQVAHKAEVQAVIDARWKNAKETGAATGRQGAGFCQNIARQMFAKLSDDEKKRWAEQAKTTAADVKAEFKRVIESPPSKDPAVRAKCIAGLPAFLQPIAEMVGAVTGLQLIVHAAGPMPQYNGEVNVITVSSGKNLETPATTVTKWNAKKFARHKEYLVDYVHTCYTDEELEAAKLPANAGGNTSGGSEALEYNLNTLFFDEEDDEESDEEEEEEDDDVEEEAATTAKQKGTKKRAVAQSDAPRKRRNTGKENRSNAQTSRAVKSLPKKKSSPLTLNNAAAPIIPPPNPTSDTPISGKVVDAEVFFGPRLPTYEERRESNMATIKLMPEYIAAFGAGKDLSAALEKPRPKPRQRTAASTEVVAPRRSSRLKTGEGVPGEETGEGQDVTMANDIVGPSDQSPDIEMANEQRPDIEMASERPPNNEMTSEQPRNNEMTSEQPPDVEMHSDQVPHIEMAIERGGNSDMEAEVNREGEREMEMTDKGVRHVVPSELDDADAEERGEEVEEALTDAPDWFKSSYTFFDKAVETLGPRWRRLLDHFVLLEAADEFTAKGSLTVDGRPVLLSKWIKQGRLTKKKTMPTDLDAGNIAEFKRQFGVWYDSLQPEWREKSDGAWTRPKLGRKKFDWGALEVGGVCGLLSIVACLYWWGLVAADMTQSEFAEWESVVEDASWVLDKIRVN